MRVVSILAMRLLVLGLLMVGLAACGAAGGGGPSDLGGVPTTIVLPSTTIGAAIGASVPAPATPQTVLPDDASLVATAITPGAKISLYGAPGAPESDEVLSDPPALTGAPPTAIDQVFRVVSQRADGWVQVQLPVPPNRVGSTGWVRDTDVTITQVSYRMRVSLSTRRLTAFGRGRQIYAGPIVVGAFAAGTPAGHYYLRGFFTAPKSRTTNSPFVYGLINKLSTLIPLGTPVDIVR
jgi:hypothetical protein